MISIYALVDPRNDEVRYIGQTTDVARRYAQHCQVKRLVGGILCFTWRYRLWELGLQPTLRVLEADVTADAHVAFERERHWAAHFAAAGHDVLNVPGGPYHDRFVAHDRRILLHQEEAHAGELVGQRPEIQALRTRLPLSQRRTAYPHPNEEGA